MGKPVHVYPVEGRFLVDQPHIEHDCTDPRCLESGAFTEAPPEPEPDSEE
jgi:hypothetical protein